MRPTNLLSEAPSPSEIHSALMSGSTDLLPPLGDPAWTRARQTPFAVACFPHVLDLAARQHKEPLPELTDALYRDFHQTGTRIRFEKRYFDRRARLSRAALCALLAEDATAQGWWLESVTGKMRAILDEVSWAFPAHVADPSGRDPLRIDLFAAETAHQMGEMITLFGHVLPADLVSTVRERVRLDIVDNFLERHEAHEWTGLGMNWNAVCHQGVIGAALALEPDTERVSQMLGHASISLRKYLQGFCADGSTSEGLAYWEYGFGRFSTLNAQLEKRTGGHLSLFEGHNLIPKIAGFGPNLRLEGGSAVNFSDASANTAPRPWIYRYLGQRLSEPTCTRLAQSMFAKLIEKGLQGEPAGLDGFYLARTYLDAPHDSPKAEPFSPSDKYFSHWGVLITRSRDQAGHLWEFAAKGGHNSEHHNHNDCGSYLLNIDATRVCLDIGSPEYVKEYFGPNRYQHLAARSFGHSTPVINGCEQGTGSEFAAVILEEHYSDNEASLSIDLTRCYPPAAHCLSCIRRLSLDKGAGRLVVEDAFALDGVHPVESAIILPREALMGPSGVEITSESVRVMIEPLEGTKVSELQSHPFTDHHGVPAEIRRAVLVPTGLQNNTRVSYAVTIKSSNRGD
jgi:hypothetical protein